MPLTAPFTAKDGIVTIICLGDSLTYGYETARARTWTALAAQETGLRILNRGINGLMTAGMAARFTQDVVAEKADAVLLMGGANDILSGLGPEEPEGNMAAMIARARQAGVIPLLGIPVPFCPPIREDWAAMADFPEKTPIYAEYVARLRALAASCSCPVADFDAALAAHVHGAGCAARGLYRDGIHLNDEGHHLFAMVFLRTLRDAGLFLPA